MLRLAFALMLTAAPALADEMTPEAREAFRAEVRAYLLENPEVLMEAMDVLQARQAEAAAAADQAALETFQAALFQDPGSWVGGNPQGDVTVVEFMDYRCSYCRKAYEEVEALVAQDGNIRFVVKEFPILGPDSLASAQFAIAVLQLHGDAAYKAAHDALITLRGTPNPETLGRLAADLGHEPSEILSRMEAPEVAEVIAANHELAQKMNFTGTPAFVIGTEILRGYVPQEVMADIVAEARS